MITLDLPPGKYFISHSYKDARVRRRMLKQLPKHVKPFIFPPIRVSANEFVSNSLISSILDCNGLIYLNEGYSAKSFWVAFERDYALRTGKPVYSYTPSNDTMTLHTSAPLDLVIFPSYHLGEESKVMKIIDFMCQNRYFDVWLYSSQILSNEKWAIEAKEGINEIIQRGGFVTVFWSAASSQSKWVNWEISNSLASGHVVIALLDDTPLPPNIAQHKNMIVPLTKKNLVIHNCIDDLIVRLYWLIFRNQFPELVYE